MQRMHPVPAEVYALVERTPASVLLEGGRQNRGEGHERPWTRLFVAPVRVCAAWHPAEVPGLFQVINEAVGAGLSAAGFFSYECGECFEPRAVMHTRRPGQPLAWFGLYERSYAFDHTLGVFAEGGPPELTPVREEITASDEGQLIEAAIAAEFALTEDEYAQNIQRIHEFIRAGDVYQLNFTAPFRIAAGGSAAAIYARLRARQPVDYGAFLHWEENRLIQSFSPELFFRIEQSGGTRRIVTRPMKGTAPRGRTTREDREIAEWLRNDGKNRSENVMIVDLLRNDLGRVAQIGSVRTERLFDVERYATLWQMTSTVSAELRPDAGFAEIFRALFPSGSVTGAPKVRAMQLIAALEEAARGVYTGAIGFFSPLETMFNVAIRTLELEAQRDNKIRGILGAGSGIVIDSDPAEEFRECRLKAEFLLHSAPHLPEGFRLIETLLWNGTYPLMEMHLERLADSAEYFDFVCDREAVRAALTEQTRQFTDWPRKVRLLLAHDGSCEVASEVLGAEDPRKHAARARIAPQRTNPADRMLYHKTTQRPLYAEAYAEAMRDGFDEALFLNTHGEVTEGAISNVFIEKNGQWATPPIACGLLAGVYRRYLLTTRPEIEERVLTLDDLRTADSVYLCNAVRGLRRAVVVW